MADATEFPSMRPYAGM